MSENKKFYEKEALNAYLNEISKYPIYSKEEQQQLAQEYKNGNLDAKEVLIKTNLRFVVKVANEFKEQLKSLSMLDIIQEGNMGLMRAIETYNPQVAALTTYAYNWIYQYIERAIKNTDSNIRTSVNLQTEKQRYIKLITQYEQEGKQIPTDEEICEILDITSNMLDNIKNSYQFDTSSLNKVIGDDEQTEIGEFVNYKEEGYKEIINQIDNHLLLLTLKEHLSPIKYYVLYHMVLSSEETTLEKVAQKFNISRERVRQINASALKDAEKIMKNPKNYFQTIKAKYKTIEKINPYPIEPNNIIKYLYAKDNLDQKERELYYLLIIYQANYNDIDYCYALNCTKEELIQIKNNLKKKIITIFKDKEAYKRYNNDTIKTLGTQIYSSLENYNHYIDFRELEEQYFNLSYSEIEEIFINELDTLTTKEQELLKRYFSNNPKVSTNKKWLEKQINLALNNYKKASNDLPKQILYDTLKKYSYMFKTEQILYLECFYFKIKDKSEFYKKYPGHQRMINSWQLIEKLEKLYFNIYRMLENNFNKEKYISIRDKMNSIQTQYLDLFYGYNCEALSITEIAQKFNQDYTKTHGVIRSARETAINIYCKRSAKKDIDKNLYIPYIINNCYEFTKETREILNMYLIKDMSYEEIHQITQLSKYRISNIITEGLRKIDFYRFDIIKPLIITKEELDLFFYNSKAEFSDLEKKIIELKYLQFKNNDEISIICSISKQIVNRAVSHFNSIYEKNQIRNVILTELEIKDAINAHHTESIITEEEKELVALYTGVKCHFNPEGKRLTASEISKLKHETKTKVQGICLRSIDKIKKLKIGTIKPELIFIPREELDKLLDDPFLPITDKEKYIICSLLELKGYKYKSLSELSEYYQIQDIKRIYYRAIVNIRKYQNNEIEGIIKYESILPNLKYFSKSDRIFIEEYYKNNLTYEQISKKYNISFYKIVDIFDRIKVFLYELTNNEQVSKFDFDYYEEAIKNPKLPFYGDLKLATEIFDMFFGQNFLERKSIPEIKQALNLELETSALNKIPYSLMLSVEKLKLGIEKEEDYTYEKVYEYFEKHKNSMSATELKIYQHYFEKINNPKFRYSKYQRPTNDIIFDLIKENNSNYFKLSDATKEDIINLIKNPRIKITRSIIDQLISLYDIEEKDIMNGKDKTKIYRILAKLEKNKKMNKFNSKKLN